ncbi:MAG: HEAT repeat domain-containing protein [Candidatus Xenobia bacterium]
MKVFWRLALLAVLVAASPLACRADEVAAGYRWHEEPHQGGTRWILDGPRRFRLLMWEGPSPVGPGMHIYLHAPAADCKDERYGTRVGDVLFVQAGPGIQLNRTWAFGEQQELLDLHRRSLFMRVGTHYHHATWSLRPPSFQVDLWKGEAIESVADARTGLLSPDWRTRVTGVVSLAASAERAAMPDLLRRVAHDPVPLVRLLAARATLRIAFDVNDLHCVRSLLTLTGPPEAPAIRLMAAESTLSWAAAGRAVPAAMLSGCDTAEAFVVAQAVLTSGRDNPSTLGKLLHHPDGLIRAEALIRIASLEGNDARSLLVRALASDPHPHVRWAALSGLQPAADLLPVCLAAKSWAMSVKDGQLAGQLEAFIKKCR